MNSYTHQLVESGIDPKTHQTAAPRAKYKTVITSNVVFTDDNGLEQDVLRITANGNIETVWATYGERSLKHLEILADAIHYLAWLEVLSKSKDEVE